MKTFAYLALFVSQLATGGVLEDVRARVAKTYYPVVVFDIDDTLTDTRERFIRVVREVARNAQFSRKYPAESKRLLKLKFRDLKYDLKDTMKSVGLLDETFLNDLDKEWSARFFSNRFVAEDRMLPGAAEYLHKLQQAGALIVYLTGRDIPRMEKGTKENLERNGFPTGELRMKPSKEIPDAHFKKTEITWIRNQGNIVALFENEPLNLNLLAEGFPAAQPVFVDSIHSPKPVEPLEAAPWILDYQTEIE